ncbi:non-homologous end-joining DNA ligase [[Mycobacterium] zoologicum]|uniref:non-homologous end-joining DNA ligase n=1 Tax=[Mycobacterium] zoologicum TaxID=2872311 RepID=UPI001CDA7D4C|nr:non-homologous end-joining DNA ligase [Mycolicibacter sp. MYC101]MEB3064298.1 non-homologous end-joining DNA ligase [Mycolicibacter sp. MYC101]
MMKPDVAITHPDRVLFPASATHAALTKNDLVDYYREIAPVMVPHLDGRPLTLTRFPGGIEEEGFIQQNFATSLPDWIDRAEVARKSGTGTVVHPVVRRREALVWAANQDCVTLHSWLSRKPHLDVPNRLVFDLDPAGDDFAVLRDTARAIAEVLRALELTPYVQTTGSRGLHVVAPVRGSADFDTAREFARAVAQAVVDDDPAHRTSEIRKSGRGGRLYVDVMRNVYGQTAVAPYSVRARPGAPVATPLEWDELEDRGMRSDLFTLRDVSKRMVERDDPWAGMGRHARSLARAMRRSGVEGFGPR